MLFRSPEMNIHLVARVTRFQAQVSSVWLAAAAAACALAMSRERSKTNSFLHSKPAKACSARVQFPFSRLIFHPAAERRSIGAPINLAPSAIGHSCQCAAPQMLSPPLCLLCFVRFIWPGRLLALSGPPSCQLAPQHSASHTEHLAEREEAPMNDLRVIDGLPCARVEAPSGQTNKAIHSACSSNMCALLSGSIFFSLSLSLSPAQLMAQQESRRASE